MKILQINNYPYAKGGADRYFLDLIELLKQDGNIVKSFSVSSEPNLLSDTAVGDFPPPINTESAHSLSNISNFFYSRHSASKLRDALKKFQPDIAHLHIYYGQLSSSILKVLKEFNIPIVQTLHDFKLVCPAQTVQRMKSLCTDCRNNKYYNCTINKCHKNSFSKSLLLTLESYFTWVNRSDKKIDLYIAVSYFQKKILVEMGIPEDRIKVVHHYVDINSIEAPLVNKNRPEYIFFAGRLEEGKGVNTLIRAFAITNTRNIKLRIAGDGSQLDVLKSLTKSLGISDRVEFLGYLTKEQLKIKYLNALFVVNPSELNETFGLTTLEAMGLGKAVIASRIGAIPEVIVDGKSGLLFEAGNLKDLSSCLSTLIEQENIRNEMGDFGFKIASRTFSTQTHLSNINNIYSSIHLFTS